MVTSSGFMEKSIALEKINMTGGWPTGTSTARVKIYSELCQTLDIPCICFLNKKGKTENSNKF